MTDYYSLVGVYEPVASRFISGKMFFVVSEHAIKMARINILLKCWVDNFCKWAVRNQVVKNRNTE